MTPFLCISFWFEENNNIITNFLNNKAKIDLIICESSELGTPKNVFK